MEDRFKFRIFCISENKMMLFNTPTLIDGDIQQGGLLFKNYNYKIKNCHELNPKDLKLMQCTGLKDKNGKLIFEGDIVKYTSKPSKKNADERIKPYTCNFLVVWDEKYTGYKLQNEKRVDCLNLGIMTEDIEIIGNIYENPELLKGGEK